MWFIHGPKHYKENQSLNLKHSCWLPCVKYVDMICGRSMVTTPIRFSKRKSMGGNILGTWATAETVAHTLDILELSKYWQQSHICIKITYWNGILGKVTRVFGPGENYFELTYTCISKKKIAYETLRSNHISVLVTTLRAKAYAVPSDSTTRNCFNQLLIIVNECSVESIDGKCSCLYVDPSCVAAGMSCSVG